MNIPWKIEEPEASSLTEGQQTTVRFFVLSSFVHALYIVHNWIETAIGHALADNQYGFR